MHNFKKLDVWHYAVQLTVDIYNLALELPREEKYGLSSQLKRSAVSIPSNIAEGAGRRSDKEFASFLSIALSSAYELETQVLLMFKLDFISDEINIKILNQIQITQKMIFRLWEKYNK